MTQDKDLSTLQPVVPDSGKCQWVQCKRTGIDDAYAERTNTMGVPLSMPGVIIFVHGVNSEGEWYFDAAREFATGLNRRLGRSDLQRLVRDGIGDQDKVTAHRFLQHDESQARIASPIIPFYWGYKCERTQRKMVRGTEQLGSTPAWTDMHGNPLRSDGAWGGGPFQNGGAALSSFWLPIGFRKDIAGGTIDVNHINPVIGRKLVDCPPRLYYAHAARRLANLVTDIRTHLPNEPINIVSHSQGTIVTLCALFYVKEAGVRAPDTVLLNSTPYRFDWAVTDYLSAANGWSTVQKEEQLVATFANAARILAEGAKEYPAPPEPDAACNVNHKAEHAYDDACYAHKPADVPLWQAEIGGRVQPPGTPRGEDGQPWWTLPKYARPDTRGKLMVNFNPGDRVIGIASVSGMGWRGIAPRYMDKLGANVQQRLFARGSNAEHNPPVGSKPTGKPLPYFYKQIEPMREGETRGATEVWHYLDGSRADKMWKIATERALWHLMPVLGDLTPNWRGEVEEVLVNAPEVPRPLGLPQQFDGDYVMYDGAKGEDPDGKAVGADAEQREDFEDDVTYQERQTVLVKDGKGFELLRYETWKEVEERRSREVGRTPVSPSNHAAILRFKNAEDGTSPVADVLSYDLTVGMGRAWHDEDYWHYLLDLADWKKSDPYYKDTENGGMGGVLPVSDGLMPEGIVARDANDKLVHVPYAAPARPPEPRPVARSQR